MSSAGNAKEARSNSPSRNVGPSLKRKKLITVNSDVGEMGEEINSMPCHVVHVRNLVDNVTEYDITRSFEHYGLITRIYLLPKKRQALVEFKEITSAINCVNDASRINILIKNSPVYLNYSKDAKIVNQSEANNHSESDNDTKKNHHILLITILNPIYPINVQVMHTITSPYGKILRIVIFRKKDVQAMVEFENSEVANKAREALNGADIYSGCCTLRIDYAKTHRINVLKNDTESWDYTLIESNELKKKPLLQTPLFGDGKPTPYQLHKNIMNKEEETLVFNTRIQSQQNEFNQSSMPSLSDQNLRTIKSKELLSLMSPKVDIQHYLEAMSPSSSAVYSPQPNNQIVLILYGLNPQFFNCDRLFNLFCLYGNVDRIKFLASKDDSAMMQMSHADSLYAVLTHLNNTNVFGRKLSVVVSKQTVLKPVPKPIDLSDGSTSYKDYSSNRNNRYQTIEAAQKNKPLAPANVLYWFNAPPTFTEQELTHLFVKHGAKAPTKVKLFPNKSDKISTGLVEWNNITDCVEGLVLVNNAEIDNPSSKFPYVIKLCFSSTPILTGAIYGKLSQTRMNYS